MRIVRPLGLRARLALALVGLVVLAVGLATLLSNRGLHPRVAAAAQARLDRSAERAALVAADLYRPGQGWSRSEMALLDHLSTLNGLSVTLLDLDGRLVGRSSAQASGQDATSRAVAAVVVSGRAVGEIVVAPLDGDPLTAEERDLQHSLDRLHLAVGAISIAAALVLAFLLAETLSRPLRRIRLAAEHMERGNVAVRVDPAGDAEVRAVGHALNRLAETLEHEEEVRKGSVADLAHELRTPVSGLLSRIEGAQDEVLEDTAANLEAMHAEALRLSRLLDDLAKLTEAERPGLLLEKRQVDLAAVARQEADAFAPRFSEKGIAFTTELEPVEVTGDPDRLSQIAANLLSNALRYTEEGQEVRLRVAPEGEAAVLEVADTGIGIAPEDLRHIFTRFWRGEKSRSRARGGAGIGLAIVHELVRAHEGRIDVESEPGRGSCFRVILEASSRPRARPTRARPAMPRAD